MAQIVETIAGDRRIQLGQEDFVRQFSFGARWSRLRLSVRLGINGTSNITSPTLFIGVMCGLTNSFKSSNTDFCFGLNFPGSTSNLNYNAGPPAWFAANVGGFDPVYRLQNTTTILNPGTGQATVCASTANNPPSHFSVDILRVGSVYSIPQFNNPATQANVQAGNTLRQLLVGQDNETATQTWVNNTNKTLSSGNSVSDPHMCDCICISWNKSSPTIELSDIQVVRFQ